MLKRYDTIGDLQGVEEVTLEQLFYDLENNTNNYKESEIKAIIKIADIAKKHNLK